MKRHFQKFRDPRFALTTLQNPDLEVRTYAELVQAAQQEREWQPTALRIAATQPLATPAAPDSIPVSELPADLELPEASPDEFPDNVASAAPPDSTNPGSPDPEPTDDNAQQILDSLLADVVTAGASLPSSSPAADDEPTPHPAPKPRRKSKSRRKSAVRGPERPKPTPLQRHARKCSICKHPYRQEIEESFLHWRSPQTIMHCFDIKTETAIYHHAHAFNFFALRNRNLQSALANVVETIDTCDFSGAEMLHAVRALAHVTEDGRWIHPTSKSEFMYSMQRLPAGAGLPTGQGLQAAQPALPAHTNALSAGHAGLPAAACLPDRQADLPALVGEPILIASRPNIKKRCNPLKTILTYSG